MKKLIALLLIVMMFVPFSAFAENEIPAEPPQDIFTVKFDGKEVKFSDQQAYVRKNKLYFPMRPMLETLGFTVTWNGETQTATAVKDDLTLEAVIGNNTTSINGVSMTTGTARLENDRTLIRQYVLRNCLGYMIRWDDVNNELSVFSPEYIKDEPFFTQTAVEGANAVEEGYDEFFDIAEKAFIIPGLNEHATPQGITYRKDINQFYLSAYFYGAIQGSVIFAVDAETGEKVGEYYLYYQNGVPYNGHVGGITVTEKDFCVVDGKNLYRVPLSQLDALGSKGNLTFEESINLALEGSTSNLAYVYCADGYLWTGNYHYSTVEKFNKKAYEDHPTIIRGYKLDMNEQSGFSAQYKTKNTDTYEYDYIPSIIYSVNEEGVQGAAVTEGSLMLACSHIEEKYGYVYVYDRPESFESEEKIIFDADREVPLIRLDLKKTLNTIPGTEEVVIVDNKVYTNFESGDIRFRFSLKGPATDSIWKIDLEKLLSPEEMSNTIENQ